MRGLSKLQSLVGELKRWSGVVGLNYHRIGEARASKLDHGLWSATPEQFDQQVAFLKSRFDLIGADELQYAKKLGRGRFMLITFDDGYADNHEVALPILQRHGARATFFVATGFLDRPRLPWWDEIAWMVRSTTRRSLTLPRLPQPIELDEPARERAVRALLRLYKSLPSSETGGLLDEIAAATETGRFIDSGGDTQSLWMSWDMVRRLKQAGMTIGGHTVNHPVLARLPPHEQWREIDGCARRLADELGAPMRVFSYPVGGLDAFDQTTRDCLQRAGVRFAFTYYGGYRSFGDWDDFDVRRVAIESEMSLDDVKARAMLPGSFMKHYPKQKH